MKRKTISTQAAKEKISIVDYLAHHGINPIGMSGNRYRFFSIFRKERTASMFIDDSIGLFNDFGYKGGSIIDLAKELHGFQNIVDTLEHLADFVGSSDLLRTSTSNQTTIFSENKSISNIKIQPLNHFVILKYLEEERKIDRLLAKKYLKLVWYDNKHRSGLFAMGWKNDSDSWELRSASRNSFKTVTGIKDITTVKGRAGDEVFVFESMLDYLSFLMIQKREELDGTVYILNSTSLVKRIIPMIENKGIVKIHTFFDNDDGGEKAFANFSEGISKTSKIHKESFYDEYVDVNEFWVAQ